MGASLPLLSLYPQWLMIRISRNETRLVELAASCDDEAFCALCDSYRQHLRVLVARYAPTRADREDIYAEIVARLLADRKRALRNWKPIAPFAAYLTTIAIRHCLNWLEQRSRTPSTLMLSAGADTDDLLEDLIAAGEEHNPEQVLARRECRQQMHEALLELSAGDRLVLALRFEQGMSGPEIGRALGITPGAARQRIFKALRRLGRIVRERDEGAIGLPER